MYPDGAAGKAQPFAYKRRPECLLWVGSRHYVTNCHANAASGGAAQNISHQTCSYPSTCSARLSHRARRSSLMAQEGAVGWLSPEDDAGDALDSSMLTAFARGSALKIAERANVHHGS